MGHEGSNTRSLEEIIETPCMRKPLVYLIFTPFLARLFKEKSQAYVVTLLSASSSASVKVLVKFFFKGLHLKNYQRYPPETWNSDSLEQGESIATAVVTL